MKRTLAITFLYIMLATPAGAGFAEGVAASYRGDYALALREFRALAEQGVVGAQLNLGDMYAEGKGVPQNYVIAYKWYNLAAKKGSFVAAQNRSRVAEKMTPAQIAEAQNLAREWLEKHGKK